MNIKLNTKSNTTDLLSVYALTLISSCDTKNAFSCQLDEAVKKYPKQQNFPRLIHLWCSVTMNIL